MLLINKRVQKILGQNRFLRKLSFDILCNIELFHLGFHKDRDSLKLIRRVRRERESLLTAQDGYVIQSLARAQSRLPGDMAEVGVYQGASAKLVCEVKGDSRLHLFDTFEGLPQPEDFERPLLARAQFASSLEAVRDYLAGYPGVHLYRGRFPDTAGPVSDTRFSFVHLDVDLYRSTLDALEFFYPRMLPAGIILSHDYSILEGVRRAFDEFLDGRPECVIDLPTTQCMLIKV